MVDQDLRRLIEALFRPPDAALAVFGVGPAAFPASWRESNLSPDLPMDERLRMLERDFKGQLELLGRQLAELGEDERVRIEGEGMALLICLRQLRRHFPEVLE